MRPCMQARPGCLDVQTQNDAFKNGSMRAKCAGGLLSAPGLSSKGTVVPTADSQGSGAALGLSLGRTVETGGLCTRRSAGRPRMPCPVRCTRTGLTGPGSGSVYAAAGACRSHPHIFIVVVANLAPVCHASPCLSLRRRLRAGQAKRVTTTIVSADGIHDTHNRARGRTRSLRR